MHKVNLYWEYFTNEDGPFSYARYRNTECAIYKTHAWLPLYRIAFHKKDAADTDAIEVASSVLFLHRAKVKAAHMFSILHTKFPDGLDVDVLRDEGACLTDKEVRR